MTRHRCEGDLGETLAEVLVAVAILGISVAALLGGIGASATGSDVHRKQAAGEVVLRGYAEAVEARTFDASSCSGAVTSYSPALVGYSAPGGYSPSVTSVVNQSPGTACTTLQLVTLQVVTSRTTLSLSFVKAAP